MGKKSLSNVIIFFFFFGWKKFLLKLLTTEMITLNLEKKTHAPGNCSILPFKNVMTHP